MNKIKVPSILQLKKTIEMYRNTEPEIKRPLNFKIVHSINKVSSPIQKYIERIDSNKTKKDDIIIAGSAATWTQVKDFRKPKDLDVETSPHYVERVKSNLVSILKRKYKNITINKLVIQKDGTKVTQIMSNNEPIIDIKENKRSGTTLDVFDDKTYNLIKIKRPIKINKIYYTRINELLARKAQATNRYYYTPIIEGKPPHIRAKKDIRDFRTISKSLERSNKNPRSKNIFEFENFNLLTGVNMNTYKEPQKSHCPFRLGGYSKKTKYDNFLTQKKFKLNSKKIF